MASTPFVLGSEGSGPLFESPSTVIESLIEQAVQRRCLREIAEINATVKAFINKIKANGVLAKIYPKWMKNPLPTFFPDSVPDIPFFAS